MKALTLVIALLLCPAAALADDNSRQRKVGQIIEAQGLHKMFRQQLEQSRVAALEYGHKIRGQMVAAAGLPNDDNRLALEQAFTRYIEGIASIWTAEELVALWSAHYGKNLSDDDLDKILAYYTSETGKKDVAASQTASVAFLQAMLAKEGKRMEALTATLTAELKEAANEQAAAGARKSLDHIRAQGAKNHPGLSVAEATALEARRQMVEKLKNEPNQEKRLGSAAASFLGYFLANSRERPTYCREQGVDIQPFVSAFERAHVKEVEKAHAILAKSQIDDEKLYSMLKPQLRQTIAEDMGQIASANAMSLKQACELIAVNGEALAAQMQFSIIQPEVFRVLSSGQ
ncbi:MAG: hypothetical protein DDT34_02254 [Firmicutes bacterium]|nr:hypothetical protein [Bacillota bacterium]